MRNVYSLGMLKQIVHIFSFLERKWNDHNKVSKNRRHGESKKMARIEQANTTTALSKENFKKLKDLLQK